MAKKMQVKEKRDVWGKNIHILMQFVKEPKGSWEKRHWSIVKSVDFYLDGQTGRKKRHIKS